MTLGGNAVPLWIAIAVAAALFQNIRTTMQQKIRGLLSVDGANFVRYAYGAPLALGMLAFLVWGTGRTTGRRLPSRARAYAGAIVTAQCL